MNTSTFSDSTIENYNPNEWLLKKLLLRTVLKEEFDIFKESPYPETLRKDTILLDFLYNQVVLDFPPFRERPDFKSTLNELLESYPKLFELKKNAFKSRSNGYQWIVNLFDLLICTPNEFNLTKNDMENNQINSARKKVVISFLRIIKHENNNVNGKVNVKGILDTIANSNSVKDLQIDYQSLFSFVHLNYSSKLQRKLLAYPSKLRKMKTILKLTPITALKTIVKYTNPIYFVNSLITLFFYKPPFGTTNMMQKMMNIACDLNKTNNSIDYLQSNISNDKFVEKIINWIYCKDEYEDSVDVVSFLDENKNNEDVKIDFVMDILENDSYEPNIKLSELERIKEEDIDIIIQLLQLYSRKKIKEEFIEIVGQDKIITIIKEIFNCVYQSLYHMYKYADTPLLMEQSFQLLKQIIEIGEEQQKEYEEEGTVDKQYYTNLFSELLFDYENCLLQFIQSLLVNDESRNILEQLIQWFFDLLLCLLNDNNSIDVFKIISELDKKDQKNVYEQLKKYENDKKEQLKGKLTREDDYYFSEEMLSKFKKAVKIFLTRKNKQ